MHACFFLVSCTSPLTEEVRIRLELLERRPRLAVKLIKNFYKGILMYLLTSERPAGLQNKHTYYIRTLLEAIESLKSFYHSSLISLIIWNRFGVFALVRSS